MLTIPSESSNPNNLPLDVAVAIDSASPAAPVPQPDEKPDTADILQRLLAIRDRLFWLHAVWATTLSPDVAYQADQYRELFRELAEVLRKEDAGALDRIVTGHESLLLSEPMKRPTVPLAAQQWHEIVGEVRNERSRPPTPRSAGYIPDGLERFV